MITESVIDAAALWSAGLRNVIPVYGVTGLTEEIRMHLVECRVRRVVLLLDADDAGRAAATEMAHRLSAVNIEARSVELPAKDAAEFLAAGGTAEDVRRILTPPVATTTNETKPALQVETSNDGSMLFAVDGCEYRIRGLSPVGLERLRVNVKLTLNGNFHLDTIDLYQARARALFAQSAAKLCSVSEQQVSADLLQMIEKLEAARLAMRKNGDAQNQIDAPMTPAERDAESVWDVRVSTNSDVNGSANRGGLQYFYEGNLGYGTSGPDNNGNVLFANTYSPEDENDVHWAITRQRYNYDSLNRLKSVTEYFVNYNHAESQQSVQTYDYDRWGNRTINTGQTSGTGINNTAFEVESARNRLYSPGDLALSESQRRIRYDQAGNQTKDTYTGYGTAIFDGDNHIVAIQDKFGSSSTYTYNANSQRVRRRINNQETWQIYGIDGELVAEYAANGAVGAPQKEYGYRDGQLLITAEAPVTNRTNVALSANGATATASSYLGAPYNLYPSYVNDGQRTGVNDSLWLDNTYQSFPDWVQIDFNGTKTINEIDVVTQQDGYNNPTQPTLDTTFTTWGATAFDVQYWNGTSWVTVPNGSVTGNNKVWRQFTFADITTSKIRITVNSVVDNAYSRVVEVEAWTPSSLPRTNYALPANGGSASASSYLGAPYNLYPSYVNDGQRTGVNDSLWLDNTYQSFPDWVQIDFNGTKTINEIDVVTQQDGYNNPAQPTLDTTFTTWGATAFDVQYWNGTSWVTVPNGSVTGNNKVWRQFTFADITTSKIRVTVNSVVDNAYSRVVELEAWGGATGSSSAKINWLVPDHLGTPRIILDQTGSFANVKRHDYLPFGEELSAATGGRTAAMGYIAGDSVRQHFTQYERDVETGLDYAVNRYYSANQGRFSGPDPYFIVVEKDKGRDDKERSQILLNYCLSPQIWNKYTYSLNNPLSYVDPDGRRPLTEVDLARIGRLNREYDKAKQAGDVDLASAISQAVNEIVTAIGAVPEGQEDPSNLKTVFFAIDQLGAKSFATSESNTFSMNGWRVTLGPGDNKCNFFVAMSWALGGGIGLNGDGNTKGVPVYGTKGGLGRLRGNGYVPGANEWSGGRVQNFTRVPTPQLGDVAAWGSQGQGHSAIYVGGGAVIYAHIFEGVKIQSVQYVNSKQNTQAAFNTYKP